MPDEMGMPGPAGEPASAGPGGVADLGGQPPAGDVGGLQDANLFDYGEGKATRDEILNWRKSHQTWEQRQRELAQKGTHLNRQERILQQTLERLNPLVERFEQGGFNAPAAPAQKDPFGDDPQKAELAEVVRHVLNNEFGGRLKPIEDYFGKLQTREQEEEAERLGKGMVEELQRLASREGKKIPDWRALGFEALQRGDISSPEDLEMLADEIYESERQRALSQPRPPAPNTPPPRPNVGGPPSSAASRPGKRPRIGTPEMVEQAEQHILARARAMQGG